MGAESKQPAAERARQKISGRETAVTRRSHRGGAVFPEGLVSNRLCAGVEAEDQAPLTADLRPLTRAKSAAKIVTVPAVLKAASAADGAREETR
jgi:hypothetical protein